MEQKYKGFDMAYFVLYYTFENMLHRPETQENHESTWMLSVEG